MNTQDHTLMMRLLDGDLAPDEAERARAHLLADPEAAAALKAHQRLQAGLGALPHEDAPSGFETRLHARLERQAQSRPWWRAVWPVGVLGAAAVAAVALMWVAPAGPGPAGVAAAGMAPAQDGVPELVVRVRAAASVQAQAQQVLQGAGLPAGGAEARQMTAGGLRAAHARVAGQMPVELKGVLPAADDAPVMVRVVVWGP